MIMCQAMYHEGCKEGEGGAETLELESKYSARRSVSLCLFSPFRCNLMLTLWEINLL